MANILDILNQIGTAVYGKDVRQAIINAIRQCYEDGKAGVNDLHARTLIEAVMTVNEQQAAEIEALTARVEELEEGESGGSSETSTTSVPTFLVESGTTTFENVGANKTATQSITFTEAFTEAPTVLAIKVFRQGANTFYSQVTAQPIQNSITAAGFTLAVGNKYTQSVSPSVLWVAFQPTTVEVETEVTTVDGMTEADVRALLAPITAALDSLKIGYDGTEYDTAGGSLREQINALHVLIGDEPGTAIPASAIGYGENSNVDEALTAVNGRLGELNSDLINDDNFYEDRTQNGEYKLTWTNGKYINTNGGVGSNNSCSATLDFIPIRSGDVLSIYCHAPGQIDVIAVYDKNKTLVEQFTHSQAYGVKSYTVEQDGFIRLSNEPGRVQNSNCYLKVTNLGNINATNNRISTVENAVDDVNAALTDIKLLVPYSFNLAWTTGKYIISANGNAGNASVMACTLDYYPVFKDQQLYVNLSAHGTNECAVAFYDTNKVYDNTAYVTSDGESIVTVPFDGYARFSTKVTHISTDDAYVKNYVSSGTDEQTEEQTGFANKKYYIKDLKQFITGETVKEFTASSPRIDGTYKGEANPNKRYLAIGFDDFRVSDYSMIIPLFEKYGGRATFNRPITSNDDLTETARNYLDSAIFGNHEVGDHTIKHMAFPYEDALFNGQNPASVDGTQTPYPTNEQIRGAEGETYNAFHSAVTDNVNAIGVNGLDSTIANTAWKDLTDAQCQTIRETFSAMKNPVLAPLLDEMSDYYLGTSGRSDGSWDSSTGKYTGGIFTGCATSANHEIWERILTIVQMYYKEKCGLNGDIQCWSWPGSYYFGGGFSSDGRNKYYRADMTLPYNMNAQFTSSLYVDELGNAKVRSFTDVLREFGYKYTHDYIFPGRMDYQVRPAMRKQFYFNEHLSKEDGVLYPTDRTVAYSAVNTSYPSTFFTTGKTKAAQMYDGGGVFYNFIEALRHDTAHGLIHGEVIDSTDSYSMKVFFEEALRFCKSAGIEVITKAEAYDICFNHPVMNGNLIYNPTFRNSAAEFFTDATNVPTNPDGYAGDCSVTEDASGNILVTTGETTYIHYGVPLGKIKYTADAKGNGTITIYLIKCGSAEALTSLEQLASISVSESDFTEKSVTAVVPNNPMVTWTPKLEGRDNKVMGLKFVYSSGLQIKNISLAKMI